MSHEHTRAVITANHLLDGYSVYLAERDRWVAHLSDAMQFEDSDFAKQKLTMVENDLSVVGPYLIEISIKEGFVRPTQASEISRVHGPTNYKHNQVSGGL